MPIHFTYYFHQYWQAVPHEAEVGVGQASAGQGAQAPSTAAMLDVAVDRELALNRPWQNRHQAWRLLQLWLSSSPRLPNLLLLLLRPASRVKQPVLLEWEAVVLLSASHCDARGFTAQLPDFGLARALQPDQGVTFQGKSGMVGTASYLSSSWRAKLQ
ncbi:hypothetical protein V8C86DRAFT_2445900 [Haematococcus lacustris]